MSFDAQTVYLQILQSGGILLMVTLMFYYLASIVVSFRLIPKYSLAAALCTSVIASLVLDLFEADLTDRFYYVPIGAILALRLVDARRSTDEPDDAEDADRPRPPAASPRRAAARRSERRHDGCPGGGLQHQAGRADSADLPQLAHRC